MVDPKEQNDNNKELKEALKTEYDEEEIVESKSNNILGFKMKKILIILVLITALLIVTLWLLSIDSSKKKNDYSGYESKMISAAKQYYKINNKELPANNGTAEVTLSKLIELKYMNDYSKIKSCSGSVTVENKNNEYSYSSYLDCGDSYTSKSLFKAITNNVVTSDYGVYRMNNEYVYRGEKVNNYVKFSGKIWRIVKIDSNNDIVLIYDDEMDYYSVWDNRYNEVTQYNTGYNNYEKSRIKDYLEESYENSSKGIESRNTILTKKASKKLVGYKLCVGKSTVNQTPNNNSYECSTVAENTKIGLLTLSDFVNASVDPACTNPSSISCENYNYLAAKNSTWWLATPVSENNSEVFSVREGRIYNSECNSSEDIRPVIHLSGNTMYSSGNGTQGKPYVIK